MILTENTLKNKRPPGRQTIKIPAASRQVAFHQLLVAARKTWLMDALAEALAGIEPATLKGELSVFIPGDVQRVLAAAGIRDEHVFPTPAILETKPTLLGYYRLLLGVPQKTFYRSDSGMSRFKSMEGRGALNENQKKALPALCRALGGGLAELVRQMSPTMTQRDVAELPLLTLGAQFQGSNNNTIGRQAVVDAFLSIREIVKGHITQEQQGRITVKNSAGRIVVIALAADPDVRIQEEFSGKLQNKVAIEIKGGTDKSNAHNRAGEAEKSHQKARGQGFRDFWTIIAKKGLEIEKLKLESPTTNSWFDAAQVLGREGEDWEEFRNRIAGQVGIPLAKGRFRSQH
ncbi:MAG: XcyI family restriction endonuclease [Candidatus Binatia bacterium]